MLYETIGDQWAGIVRTCLREGGPFYDADVSIQEKCGFVFEIASPGAADAIVEKFGSKKMIEDMRMNFMSFEPQFGYKFAYGEKIFRGDDKSAYAAMIAKLKDKPETKSATIGLTGLQGDHVPCVTTIDFKIRDGRLNVYYFARSQDGYKKAYADNLAIHQIQKKAATELGVVPGSIAGYIASAHVYDADLEAAEALIKGA